MPERSRRYHRSINEGEEGKMADREEATCLAGNYRVYGARRGSCSRFLFFSSSFYLSKLIIQVSQRFVTGNIYDSSCLHEEVLKIRN